jgi:hypothetical protein
VRVPAGHHRKNVVVSADCDIICSPLLSSASARVTKFPHHPRHRAVVATFAHVDVAVDGFPLAVAAKNNRAPKYLLPHFAASVVGPLAILGSLDGAFCVVLGTHCFAAVTCQDADWDVGTRGLRLDTVQY